MLNLDRYQILEAVEELLDEYDVMMAGLDAEIALATHRSQIVQTKIEESKNATEKYFAYKYLVEFHKEIHSSELKLITCQQHQDGLNKKLRSMR